jgi:hypothetical protein
MFMVRMVSDRDCLSLFPFKRAPAGNGSAEFRRRQNSFDLPAALEHNRRRE